MLSPKRLQGKLSGFSNFFSITTWVFRFYFSLNRTHFILFILTTIFINLLPIINSWVVAFTIDQAVFVKDHPSQVYSAFFSIAVIITAIRIISAITRSLNTYLNDQFRIITDSNLRLQMGTILRSVGTQTLEDPTTTNLTSRADSAINNVPFFFERSLGLLASVISLVGTFFIIFHFMPLLIPFIFLTVTPAFFLDSHFLKKLWRFNIESTEPRRMAYNSLYALSDPHSVQELSLTGGYKMLTTKAKQYFSYHNLFHVRARKTWYLLSFLIDLPRFSLEVVSSLWIIRDYILHRISLGQITFYANIVNQAVSGLNNINSNFNNLNEMSVRIQELKQVFNLTPSFNDGSISMPALTTGPAISFHSVNFSYPNSSKTTLSNINIDIKSGEKVAIVGHNGAGKTTLIKLLCRYYQPTSGGIFINDYNLNDLKITSWYQNIGVLFQEFNLFSHLTPSESIRLGRHQSRFKFSTVKQAAKMADADEYISGLKNGYHTILSERFKDGTRPSTGQAQKIAIARFFYRDAPLAIFDEPTASIDALAEKKIFDRIYKFFTGKTVILISHRFSTVRNADRIIVLSQGKIIEQGSHTELLKLDGVYAHSFNIQAEGYK